MKPSVSICMPAFNTERFIAQAIESIKAQTFKNFELIVVDDGSDDNTWEIASQCAADDERIKILANTTNRGLVYTRNLCIEKTRAPIVAMADSDDVFHTNRIRKQFQYMQGHPEIGVLHTNVYFIDDSGSTVAEPSDLPMTDTFIRFFLMLGPCIWNSTTMYRRELLIEAGGYRPGFEGGAEDYDLWSRMLKITKFAGLRDKLISQRLHESSVTAGNAVSEHNIFAVAAEMLAEYVQHPVKEQVARDFLVLFWQGLTETEEAREALRLASNVKAVAACRETRDTLREYRRKMHAALWTHAQSRIYKNRRQSLMLALSALLLDPKLLPTRRFAEYISRWVLPDRVRMLLKPKLSSKRRGIAIR